MISLEVPIIFSHSSPIWGLVGLKWEEEMAEVQLLDKKHNEGCKWGGRRVRLRGRVRGGEGGGGDGAGRQGRGWWELQAARGRHASYARGHLAGILQIMLRGRRGEASGETCMASCLISKPPAPSLRPQPSAIWWHGRRKGANLEKVTRARSRIGTRMSSTMFPHCQLGHPSHQSSFHERYYALTLILAPLHET